MRDGEIVERAYQPLPRFDATIGYWTGEPDDEALAQVMNRLAREAPGVAAVRCRLGHVHLRGPATAVAAAEAAILPADRFHRVKACAAIRV